MKEQKTKKKPESYYKYKKKNNIQKIPLNSRLNLSKNYSSTQLLERHAATRNRYSQDYNIPTTSNSILSATNIFRSNFSNSKNSYSRNYICSSFAPIIETESSENNIDLINDENYFINDFYNIQSKLKNNNNIFLNQKILEFNDLIEQYSSTPINLNILKKHFDNFSEGKISSKSFGLINSYAANTNQGINRNYNEDRVSIIINMNIPQKHINSISYFGIFDGHSGNKCAEFLRNNLLNYIYKNKNFPDNITLAIKEAFIKADRDYIQKYIYSDENNVDKTGSCALILLIINEKIYIANCGDSRCIISAKNRKIQKDVTRDHKPNYPYEKQRILNNGGRIYRNQIPVSSLNIKNLDINLDDNLLLGPYRVLPGKLSVSRTIGDAMAKIRRFGGNQKVIIPEPDIYVYDYKKDDIDFFIMGCDGIFDRLSSKDVFKCANLIIDNNNIKLMDNNDDNEYFKSNYGDLINMNTTCGDIVDFIIKSSMIRKSLDNLTCIMIAFKNMLVNNNSNINNNEENMIQNNYNKINNKVFEKDIKTINLNINKEKNKKETNNTEKITDKKFNRVYKNVEIRKLMSVFNESHSNINIHNKLYINNKFNSNRSKDFEINQNLYPKNINRHDKRINIININTDIKNTSQVLENLTNLKKKENINTEIVNSPDERNKNYVAKISNTENNINCSKIHNLLKNNLSLKNIGIDFGHIDSNALTYLRERKPSLNQDKNNNEILLTDKNKNKRCLYNNRKVNDNKEFEINCVEKRVTFRKINRVYNNCNEENDTRLKTDVKNENKKIKCTPEIITINQIFKRNPGNGNK